MFKRNRPHSTIVAGLQVPVAVLFLLGLMTAEVARAEAATQRPISDFTSAQGTTMVFTPPARDVIAWSTCSVCVPGLFAWFDYAGRANATQSLGLGTATEGSITERPLSDGRADVKVVLHTRKALSWAAEFNPFSPPDPNTSPLLFGWRAQDILADPNKTAALADSNLVVEFKNTAPGAPLPDLVDAFILGNASAGQEIISISFYATASGPLHANAGVAEGTPGRCTVAEAGVLFKAKFMGATGDGFPVELVELRAVGK